MKVRFTALLALVLSTLVLAAATAATAAPQGPWVLPATDVSDASEDGDQSQVAVGPDGTTTVVWRRKDGVNRIVRASTRPGGSSAFEAPVDLSAPGQTAYTPQVAIGPNGTTTVVWLRSDGANPIVQAATRPAGSSTFEAPVNLSAPGQDAFQPQVATAPDGTTTVVWLRSDGANPVVQAATRPAGSSTFEAPVNLSAPGQNAEQPQVATAPDGTTTVAWLRSDGANNIVQESTRPAGSNTFSSPTDLSIPGHGAFEMKLAIGFNGTTAVVWRHNDGPDEIVQAAVRPYLYGPFEAQTALSAPGRNAYKPQAAVGPDGTTTITWYRSDGSHSVIQASTRPPGGVFGSPENLSDASQNAYNSGVAAAPDGTTTVVWQRMDGANYIVQASTRPAGSNTFQTPTDLSASGRNAERPKVVVAPDGVATAIWERNDVGGWTVQGASTAQPLLLAVSRLGTGSGKVTSSPAGINCGGFCYETFLPGTTVSLTATPAPGSAFAGWSWACSGSARTCAVTMSEDRQVAVMFLRVPANPPDDSTAIYYRSTGRLKIRLKCGAQYRPKCLTIAVRAVTGTGKRAKMMSGATAVKKVRAGKWKLATLKIRPGFRQRVRRMGNSSGKTLWTRITVTWKKKGKKQARTTHRRYRVMVRQ